VQQGGEIHARIANNMNIDRVVCDQINHPVRAGDCLAELIHVQLTQLVDPTAGIREVGQSANCLFERRISLAPRCLTELADDVAPDLANVIFRGLENNDAMRHSDRSRSAKTSSASLNFPCWISFEPIARIFRSAMVCSCSS
jgi:hypothetical protein